MSQPPAFKITYWGVTGTFCDPLRPSEVTQKVVSAICRLVEKDSLAGLHPGPELEASVRAILKAELPFDQYSSYGGNTTCVEVETADALFILDCGSGFRELGNVLETRWKNQGEAARREAHVLLSHSHLDHTFATPYFSPYYNSKNTITMWGPQGALDSLAAVLDPKSLLSQVYFPPTYSEMKGLAAFRPLAPNSEVTIGSTRIRTLALNHPGGSMGYRFENNGRVFVFATDHEQTEVPDGSLTDFARGADLIYTEGQYTNAEYSGQTGVAGEHAFSHLGWGHSPMESCIVTALAAGARRLHIGHRDPRRSDAQIAEFEAAARTCLREAMARHSGESCEVAVPFEGLQIEL